MRPIHSDHTILTIMDRMAAGEDSGTVGRSLGIKPTVVRTIWQRVNKAHEAVPCLCEKPENKDGGMPHRWWEGAHK